MKGSDHAGGVNSPLASKWPEHFRWMVALSRAHAHAHVRDEKKTPDAEQRKSNPKSSEETTPILDHGF